MFEGQNWYEYLDEPMRDLVTLSFFLLEREEMEGDLLSDYSFVVFPTAKAYEGFLKKLFFDLELIDENDLMGKNFRIGRSMNPSLPEEMRDSKWVYGKMERLCAEKKVGNDLPRRLWEGWKLGRNRVFHYFMGEKILYDLATAKQRFHLMVDLMKETIDCTSQIRKMKKSK